MNAFQTFLQQAIHHENTHEFIIKILLENEPEFQVNFLGKRYACIAVERQFRNGLFDLAVMNGKQCLAVIELKMWAQLSENQLKKQFTYVQKHQLKCYYLLLGKSHLEYVEFDHYNFLKQRIRHLTKGQVNSNDLELVEKIGYEKLIFCLDSFKSTDYGREEIRKVYLQEITQSMNSIYEAYKNQYQNDQLRDYSRFWQIQQRCRNLKTQIKTISNRGSSKVEMLDNGTWIPVLYKSYRFELYQQLTVEKGLHVHQVKIYNVDNLAPRIIRLELLAILEKYTQYFSVFNQGENKILKNRGHKWIVLLEQQISVSSQSDFQKVATEFQDTNTVISKVAHLVNAETKQI